MAVEQMALQTAIRPPLDHAELSDRSAALVYAVAKRAIDVVGAIVGLLMLLPLFALVGLAICLDSGWPVFYRGERVGRQGRAFKVLKFRSMRTSAGPNPHVAFVRSLMRDAESCAVYKVPGDPRITRVGAFLRRTSLDEFPQLWNVLWGDMSLVGPRPDVDYAVTDYDDWMQDRLAVKPGMTGLWQVSGRSRLSLLDMYRLDVAYVAEASLRLDLSILLRTVPVVLGRDGAA
jgi:lipopolysaccharide/colanic/teichoic acid biosynthesis glycosyltransferase